MAPVEMDFDWKNKGDEEDEDVDMIPLIDISLVLLIFFMMTMTVAAMSRIRVPDMRACPDTLDRTRRSCGSTSTCATGKRVYRSGTRDVEPGPRG